MNRRQSCENRRSGRAAAIRASAQKNCMCIKKALRLSIAIVAAEWCEGGGGFSAKMYNFDFAHPFFFRGFIVDFSRASRTCMTLVDDRSAN